MPENKPFTLIQALKQIKKYQNKDHLAGMVRFGMNPKNRLGLSVIQMRKIAKDIGKNHALALKLYDRNLVEGRIIAALIDEPAKVTKAQMNKWVKSLTSWDDTDQVCMNLFDKTPHAPDMIEKWHKSKYEFVKRSAYSLIASLAIHDKDLSDDFFIKKMFPIIKYGALDDRNFVKKAASWALRQIGKRNLNLNKQALNLADDLMKTNSQSSRWIGKDALKELKDKKVIYRISNKKN